MKKYFDIFQDKLALITTSLAGVLLVISILLIGLFYRFLPPFIPLYNRLAWGYTRLGRTYEIFIPLGIAFLFILFNLWYSNRVQKVSVLLSRFLFLTNLLLALFTAIFLLKLVSIIA